MSYRASRSLSVFRSQQLHHMILKQSDYIVCSKVCAGGSSYVIELGTFWRSELHNFHDISDSNQVFGIDSLH